MSWTTVQEAIRQSVITVTGLVDYTGADGSTTIRKVDWQHRYAAQNRWQDGPLVDLSIESITPWGDDEVRYTFDEDEDTNTPTYNQFVTFIVRATVRTISQEPGNDALAELSSRLRVRMGSAAVLDLLRAANVSFQEVAGCVMADYRNSENRWQSAASVDLRFATVEAWEDTSEAATGYVARATGTGTLTVPGGATKSAPFDSDLAG